MRGRAVKSQAFQKSEIAPEGIHLNRDRSRFIDLKGVRQTVQQPRMA
jgi:hypothetical protein